MRAECHSGGFADGEQLGCRGDAGSAAAAARGLLLEEARAATDTAVWEDELDAVGSLVVAGDLGDHTAGLLVPGQGEERGRPAVGLHADEVEVALGLA